MDFSSIRKKLVNGCDNALHRQAIVLAGRFEWQQNLLCEILRGHESEAIWFGESGCEKIQSIPHKKASNWLGSEKQVVVFDATKDFDSDAFAAVNGIVMGGGFFFLLLRSESEWKKYYSGSFSRRLIHFVLNEPGINFVRESDSAIHLNNLKVPTRLKDCSSPYITYDQQQVVENIEQVIQDSSGVPVVLVADRGRGKSAALGIAAAKLVQQGVKKIIITGPGLRATDIVFKHVQRIISDAVVSSGKIAYLDSVIQFYPPDKLQQDSIDADILFVDEAATIPVPLLTTLLEKFPQCVFATTVHGYEGTGRGFSVRFSHVLETKNPAWIKLQMKTPARWAENDPFETWMFNLLCLDAELPAQDYFNNFNTAEVQIKQLSGDQIAKNEQQLKEVFALLVVAHYRTRPSDLQRLMDESEQTLYIACFNQHVVAVALINHEGKFTAELSTEVYRGRRRPPGHLLAQALTYHCGLEHAATLDYARVMRIAVHPELQRRGVGTFLLNHIIKNEKTLGHDAIGVSFGMTLSLLNFWQDAGFSAVRIGFTREQSSGEHAVIMLKALSNEGIKVEKYSVQHFSEQLPYLLGDVLKDIPEDLKDVFTCKTEKTLLSGDIDEKELNSFIKYSRNYELCIAAVNKLVVHNIDIIEHSNFPVDFKRVLINKVVKKSSWQKISHAMKLGGKKAARKLFYQAIVYLYQSISNK